MKKKRSLSKRAIPKNIDARPIVITQPVNLLTVAELAPYLGISQTTLFRWVSQGKIPHYFVGKGIRFNKAEIDKWIRK